MASEIQPPDPAQKTEALHHQVDETRSDLVEKLEQLEHQVVEIVHGATDTVTQAIGSVKDSVGHTVEAVQGTTRSVKHALDIRHHIREHPWLMLGTAFVLGYLCGGVLARR